MKCHYVSSPTPLKEGSDIKAACGVVVPKAAFVRFGDSDTVTTEMPIVRGGCRRCFDADWRHRFVYVICAGQESITEVA